MSPAIFWKSTPRKLYALIDAHGKANKVDDKKPNKKGKSAIAKKPETTVDKLGFM